MKKEPLQGKLVLGEYGEPHIFFEENVRSAVYYLKREILCTSIQKLKDDEIDEILSLIDKCFEDVIK